MESHARLHIYKPDGTTLIAIVPRRKGLQWLNEVNAPGTGRFDIHMHDPLLVTHPDLLDEFNVAKIAIDGVWVKAWIIEDVNPTRLASGEASDEWITVAGRGVMAALENAIVYPEYGIREYVSEDRVFSFASRDGVWRVPAEWIGVSGHRWRDDTTARKGLPKDWPDPDAYWLWSSNTQKTAEPGRNWFRTVFSTTATEQVVVKATADNDFVCYLDGELILTNAANRLAFQETYEWSTVLATGEHTLAAVVTNATFVGTTTLDNANPAGWIFTIYRANELGDATESILIRSETTNTIVKPYGEAPGFAGAMILRQVITEAQERIVRGLMPVTFSFTNTADSAGVAWGDVQDRIVKVATTDYWDLTTQLIELVMDVDIDANFVLHAWNRRGVDRRNTVILRPNRDLTAAAGTIRSSKLKNQALLKFEGGWIELYAAISKEEYGRREVGISLGTATSTDQTILAGAATMREVANPEKTIPLSYTSAAGPQPFRDFDLGDTITVPDVYEGMVPARLMSIAGAEDDAGLIAWDLDFYPETPDDVIDSVVVSTGGAYNNPSKLYEQQVLSDSPWAYHRFKEPGPDDGGDIYMYDASGKGRFLTVRHPAGTGGPLYNQPGPVDRAMLYSNVVAQYAESPGGVFFAQGISTVELWVKVHIKPAAASGEYSPLLGFSESVGATVHDKEIGLRPDGRLYWYVTTSAGASYLHSTALTDGLWYHVACSIGPEGQKIYLNGNIAARSATVTTSSPKNQRLFLRNGGSGHQNLTSRVEVAETAAYGQQLFDSRIKAHWDAAGYTA